MKRDQPPSSIAPSMADVARSAGVHQTTVSRALRNDPRITPTVRAKVHAAAAQLGYRPNPLLSVLGSLRRQRASNRYQATLAYIMRQGHITHHHAGVVASARQRGFKVETFEIGPDLPEARLNKILMTRNIQGLILGPLPEAHGHFTLDWERFATVVIEYSFNEPAFDRVVTDSYGSMLLALNQCRSRGYSRIGIALTTVVDERNEGLLCAAYALQLERDPEMAKLKPLLVPAADEKKITTWIHREKPEVIITSNLLLPAIEAVLKRKKWTVPRHMGLVNLNILPERGSYSGIHQDPSAIGIMAARLVIEKINHNDYGIPASRATMLTSYNWVEGGTLLSRLDS